MEALIPEPLLVSLGDVIALVTSLVLLAVTAASLRSALRLMFTGSDLARAQCRRWRFIASAVALAWYAFATGVHVEPLLPILVASAAADCWLVTIIASQDWLPRATAIRCMPLSRTRAVVR